MPFFSHGPKKRYPNWCCERPEPDALSYGEFLFEVSDHCYALWRQYLKTDSDIDYFRAGLVADRLGDERDAALALFPYDERAAAGEWYDATIAFYAAVFRSPERGAPVGASEEAA